MYIPPRRPIIPRADFDILKTLVDVLGNFNGNHRKLGDRQLIELLERGG